jgi:outer membrane protein OmpA-like peptidoglycan-associated protein
MRALSVAVLCFALVSPALAAPTRIPTEDVAGAADLAWLKRYAGSLIVDFKQTEFDEVDLPAGVLKPQPGQDEANNSLRVPEAAVTLQGKLTRFVYLLPEGRSPLEVVEGYRQELGETETVFACKERACGGAPGNAVDSGGDEQGLVNYLFDREELPKTFYSPGWCILGSRNSGQRYALIKTRNGEADVHVAVFAAQVNRSGGDCGAFDKRTVAIVTVIEEKPREQNMETVTAEKIGADIASAGRVALYGILFDTDKASIKPESEPQLAEIAAFLKSAGDREFLVVGHTDNVGAIDYNQDLSERRAAAVVAALRKAHGVEAKGLTPLGVGMASPVAANADDAGRALNRRVEIVAR